MTQRPARTAFWVGAAACLVAVASASAQTPWREAPLEAPGPQGPLRGTLMSPAGTASAAPPVLIVPGSGPTDRDGNNPQGIRAATYRWLAQGLAARGIPSVRIDKRGMFGSASAIANANDVRMQDYADDLVRWTRTIRQRTGASCVWLAGHSEGGVAALLASRAEAGLCGLILIATPGRPMGQLLREQLRANPANAPLLEQALAAIDSLEAGQRVDTTRLHPALHPLFHASVQGFLIDSFAIDPAWLVAQVQLPTLIVQGARDLQVTLADARRLKDAAPRARLAVIATANHVLKPVESDDLAANLATYGLADLGLAPGVVDAIAGFVEAPPAR